MNTMISMVQRINELADSMINEALPTPTEELFSEFEKNGNRLNYEAVYFRRRKFLAVYGLAAQFCFKTEYLQKLEEILTDICNETTWALPAHVNRTQKGWEKTLDLFSCETACALALILEGNGNRLSKDTVNAVLNEIGKRIILPFINSTTEFGFEYADHNWNAVCCGSIGVVLVTCGQNWLGAESIRKCLRRINKALNIYLSGFSKDGACLEGVGYYNYGMSFFLGYRKRAEEYLNEELFDDERIKVIGNYPNMAFFDNGKSLNFSDAVTNERIHGFILTYMSKQYGIGYCFPDSVLADFECDNCYRYMPLLDDVLSEKHRISVKKIKTGAKASVLENAEIVKVESENDVFFAIKGGNNGEPHNHNDVGSFIYGKGNETIAAELGAGEYTKDYFNEGRYGILCNSSYGHSVPIICGEGQQTGKICAASDFMTLNYRSNTVVRMDISKAYGLEKGTIIRSADFNKENGELLISDELDYSLLNLVDKDVEFVSQIIAFSDISEFLEIEENTRVRSVKTAVHVNHSGKPENVFIYELENQNGNCKENLEDGRVGRIAYRLHP